MNGAVGTTTSLISISALPAYSHKSQNELRWEDYQQGFKMTGARSPPRPPVDNHDHALVLHPQAGQDEEEEEEEEVEDETKEEEEEEEGEEGEDPLSCENGLVDSSRRFTVQEVLGKGSYGVVCQAIDNLTGQRVAIKRIQNIFGVHVLDATRILREIKLLRLLKHPDLVEIRHIILPKNPRTFNEIYVVFELMEFDLHAVIGSNNNLTPDHHKVS